MFWRVIFLCIRDALERKGILLTDKRIKLEGRDLWRSNFGYKGENA